MPLGHSERVRVTNKDWEYAYPKGEGEQEENVGPTVEQKERLCVNLQTQKRISLGFLFYNMPVTEMVVT